MAKEDLIREAAPIIENHILNGDEYWMKLMRKFIEEELETYSNPQIREIIERG